MKNSTIKLLFYSIMHFDGSSHLPCSIYESFLCGRFYSCHGFLSYILFPSWFSVYVRLTYSFLKHRKNPPCPVPSRCRTAPTTPTISSVRRGAVTDRNYERKKSTLLRRHYTSRTHMSALECKG